MSLKDHWREKLGLDIKMCLDQNLYDIELKEMRHTHLDNVRIL